MEPKLTILFQLLTVLFLLQLNAYAVNTSIIAISHDNGSSILILLDRNVEVVNTSRSVITNIYDTSSETASMTILSVLSSIINYITQNIASLFFIVLLVMLYYWIKRDEGMIIMPFEVINGENKYTGKAISNMLAAELMRIGYINSTRYEGIENLDKISQITTVETPQRITPEEGTISSFIPAKSITVGEPLFPQIGTIPLGSASVSIGELMLTIKKFFRESNYKPTINGSIYTFGSKTKLVACLNGSQSCTWEVYTDNEIKNDRIDDFDKMSKEDDEYSLISDLVRDLSFRIFYDLARVSISAKTLLGFKYYTEALDNYRQYILNQQIYFIERASKNCINAANIERKYKKTFGLFVNLGIAYFNKKMYDDAEKMFSKALEQDPRSAIAWGYKGMVLDYQGKYDEAIKAYDEAIRLDPKLVLAWNSKGWVFYKQMKYDQAIKAYDEAIKQDSQFAMAWNNKGVAFTAQGKYDEAIKAYDEAIRLDSNLVASLNNKGYALNMRGDALHDQGKRNEAVRAWDEAIKACDDAIKLDPNYPVPWNNKGYALNRLGRFEEAIKVLDRTIELVPNYATSWNNKGYALNGLGRYEEAIKVLDKATELNPQDADAWRNTGEALKALGRTEESNVAFAKEKTLRFFSTII
jgi:tetratricopeptide (TPR) repeat protein